MTNTELRKLVRLLSAGDAAGAARAFPSNTLALAEAEIALDRSVRFPHRTEGGSSGPNVYDGTTGRPRRRAADRGPHVDFTGCETGDDFQDAEDAAEWAEEREILRTEGVGAWREYLGY